MPRNKQNVALPGKKYFHSKILHGNRKDITKIKTGSVCQTELVSSNITVLHLFSKPKMNFTRKTPR